METVTVSPVNGFIDDHHRQLEDDESGGATPGEIDLHTAARHGTASTVERLWQRDAGSDLEEQSGRLRRGAVESTPAHDAAATGNVDTLSWLITHTDSPQLNL